MEYEELCQQHYEGYWSGNIFDAKAALSQVVELSLEERNQTYRLAPVENNIAFAYARLALIEEFEGKREEANELFSKASEHMALAEDAFTRMKLDFPDILFSEVEAKPAERWSRDSWLYFIGKLDQDSNLEWIESNEELVSIRNTPEEKLYRDPIPESIEERDTRLEGWKQKLQNKAR